MPTTQPKTIIGLIGASAPGGHSYFGGEWDLIIHFAAWRYADSPIIRKKLRIEMPVVSRITLREYMNTLEPYQIIEVEVGEDIDDDLKRITQITRLTVSDPELITIASELQKPVVLDHAVFGKLTYDRRFRLYRGNITWGTLPIQIELICPDPDETDSALATAIALFQEQANWVARVNDYAVQQLMPLKNESWLDDDEEPVTKEAFISRMTLQAIEIGEDGEFTFSYGDGDLFWGHIIYISGNLKEGFTLADITG